MRILISVCILLVAFSCRREKDEGPDYREGTILVEAESRVSFQYLIRVDGQSYWPDNLPQVYQNPDNHERPILVRFELTGQSQDVNVPDPSGIPVFGYTVQRVRILSIKDP